MIMDKESKELLLKDLCARLPYGVKGRVYAEATNGEYDIDGDLIFFDSPFDVILDDINISTEEIHVIAIGNEDTVDFIEEQQIDGKPYTIDEFKPYLRPMSELKDEELLQFGIAKKCFDDVREMKGEYYVPSDNVIDWVDYLNSHFYDYSGLIEQHLSIQASEGMYD